MPFDGVGNPRPKFNFLEVGRSDDATLYKSVIALGFNMEADRWNQSRPFAFRANVTDYNKMSGHLKIQGHDIARASSSGSPLVNDYGQVVGVMSFDHGAVRASIARSMMQDQVDTGRREGFLSLKSTRETSMPAKSTSGRIASRWSSNAFRVWKGP